MIVGMGIPCWGASVIEWSESRPTRRRRIVCCVELRWLFCLSRKRCVCLRKRMATATGKCVLVTGPPGVGKTTLIMRVIESLRNWNPNLKLQGFYTSEIREGSERVGFRVITLDGRTAPLASTSISTPESLRWPNVGRYKVDVSSFESLAIPELQIREDTDLFIIDEVGKMELFSPLFFPAVLKVLESNIPLLATIPVPKSGRDIPAVARLKNHPGAAVFTLSQDNRDNKKEQIYRMVANCITNSNR